MFICSDYFILRSAHLVGDLHDGAAVAAVGVVGHVLDPAVGQRHGVLALDVAALVPGPGPIRDEYCGPVPAPANHSAPGLAEVGVVVVVVDPVGEVEGVGLVALLVISAVGDGSHAAEGNSGEQGGDCEGLRKNI